MNVTPLQSTYILVKLALVDLSQRQGSRQRLTLTEP